MPGKCKGRADGWAGRWAVSPPRTSLLITLRGPAPGRGRSLSATPARQDRGHLLPVSARVGTPPLAGGSRRRDGRLRAGRLHPACTCRPHLWGNWARLSSSLFPPPSCTPEPRIKLLRKRGIGPGRDASCWSQPRPAEASAASHQHPHRRQLLSPLCSSTPRQSHWPGPRITKTRVYGCSRHTPSSLPKDHHHCPSASIHHPLLSPYDVAADATQAAAWLAPCASFLDWSSTFAHYRFPSPRKNPSSRLSALESSPPEKKLTLSMPSACRRIPPVGDSHAKDGSPIQHPCSLFARQQATSLVRLGLWCCSHRRAHPNVAKVAGGATSDGAMLHFRPFAIDALLDRAHRPWYYRIKAMVQSVVADKDNAQPSWLLAATSCYYWPCR